MKIPDFLSRDDYLQNPIMRRFLKEHDLKFVENRADYINAIKNILNKVMNKNKKPLNGF